MKLSILFIHPKNGSLYEETLLRHKIEQTLYKVNQTVGTSVVVSDPTTAKLWNESFS